MSWEQRHGVHVHGDEEEGEDDVDGAGEDDAADAVHFHKAGSIMCIDKITSTNVLVFEPENPTSMLLVDQCWRCLFPKGLTPSNYESFCVFTFTESSQCQYRI